ncbi:hypothetical protein D915_006841 [Fasciola hepatica]|uniref:RNase NYN domain-containing protein n=1 Tax=Fasciola hepatica TaxID=6192 RepID=A0A4E0RL12_FASHE|nr:hypothetical protein D915_006841 [Fasciola hepatica]
MDVYVSIPDAVEDINILVDRLRRLYNVTVQIQAKYIRISGPPDRIFMAQNCALRFIGPESVLLIHVASECFQLFSIPSLVQHFEDIYQVFLLVKHPQGLLIKGPKKSTGQLHNVIKDLEGHCLASHGSMTQFEWDNLRVLCQKYHVQFEDLPRTNSLRTALLAHFLSLLKPALSKVAEEEVAPAPSFIEAYRKDTNKEPVKATVNPMSPVIPVKSVKETRDATIQALSPLVPLSTQQTQPNPDQLRAVVIDGSNVAFNHGKQLTFSPQGIRLALEFFIRRGHTNVVAVVPRFRRGRGGYLFDDLERSGYLCYSSSRFINDEHQVADDDRIILQLAVQTDAVVVSNDQFRNYRDENEDFRDLIDNRLLQYTMALNTFLIADDPHGPKGPSLDECLRVPKSLQTNKVE